MNHVRRRQWHPTPVLLLENPMDGGAGKAGVHGVAEGRTWLSDFPCTFHFHALEKEMATHSSVLAWRIPWTEEPGGLQSMGLQRDMMDRLMSTTTKARRWTQKMYLLICWYLTLKANSSQWLTHGDWSVSFACLWTSYLLSYHHSVLFLFPPWNIYWIYSYLLKSIFMLIPKVEFAKG